jgi:Xaa-Pro dipeptidase
VTLEPLGESFYRRKLGHIQTKLAEAELDGILLLDMYNVMYASGFFHSPSERPIGFYIPASGEPTLYIPLLEQDNAADGWVKDIRTYFEFPGDTHPVLWMALDTGAQRLGIDGLEHSIFIQVQQSLSHAVISPIVDTLRYCKEPEELMLIRKSASYADYFLQFLSDHAGELIRNGATELDILNACLVATKKKQAQELGEVFAKTKVGVTATVHTGPRAALPHGKPIHRKPNYGDVLIAGIGASVGGYHAESGATFVLGEVTPEQLHCLNAAATCNDVAVAALRVGASCKDVNEAALEQLKEAGLADFIRHRIGHGMGIQGHEAPWLAPGDNTKLLANMVFSNEPGIYRPDVDGYRTINTMIVTEGEAEVPSMFLKNHPPEARVLKL